MHTIIPGMVFRDGEFLMSFGVVGGNMQPQGHVQFLGNMFDFGMNLQEAVDAPRIRHAQSLKVYKEKGITDRVASDLARRGHQIIQDQSPVNEVSGGQAIYFDRDQGVLLGASDRRKDGCALGY
jgi:gamma-glutamyltranspeptidase/glutathione hydrolase